MTDKFSPDGLKNDQAPESDSAGASTRKSWGWRVLGIAAVFMAWLLYGGQISTVGMILAVLLIGGGGLLTWFSYRK